MSQLQTGDLNATAPLYERYKHQLWTFFYNNTQDRLRSEDLVQITFEKIIKYRKSYRHAGTVKAWIFSIARNALKDEQHKQRQQKSLDRSEEEFPDHSPGILEQFERQDKEQIFQLALDSLTDDKRELLTIVKLQQKKYKEVAEIYQLSEAAVKVRVFRILQELKGTIHRLTALHS